MNSYGKQFQLIRTLAWANLKVRYDDSTLGFMWSFLRPLVIFTTLYVVLDFFVRLEIENFALFLFSGVVFWNFFAEVTALSIDSLIDKAGLIKKIAFPHHTLIYSIALSSGASFIINLLIVLGIAFYEGVGARFQLLALVFPVVSIFLSTCGISMYLCAYFPTFRDVRNIWEVALQLGFLATPIIYSIEMVPEGMRWLFTINPVALAIIHARSILLYAEVPSPPAIFGAIAISLVVFLLGWHIYEKRSRYFAEYL